VRRENRNTAGGSEAAVPAGSPSLLRGRVTTFGGALFRSSITMGTGTEVMGSIEGLMSKHMTNCLPLRHFLFIWYRPDQHKDVANVKAAVDETTNLPVKRNGGNNIFLLTSLPVYT
jgi:hypothetical protein